MKAITLHTLALAAAVVALMAAIGNPPSASAECCGFGIVNNTICTYRVCVALPGRDTCYAVPPGSNSYTLPECGTFPFYVVDICGRPIRFPQNDGDCVRANMGTCCLLICRISECRYDISYGHCEPCS
jgi:hypothetical protein